MVSIVGEKLNKASTNAAKLFSALAQVKAPYHCFFTKISEM